MTICFLSFGLVVMAQEGKTPKPAATTATKKSKAQIREAKYARLTALKKERAAAEQKNQQPGQGSQPEQSIQKPTAAPAERSKQ